MENCWFSAAINQVNDDHNDNNDNDDPLLKQLWEFVCVAHDVHNGK